MENTEDNNYKTVLRLFIMILDRVEDSELRDVINYYKSRILPEETNNRDDTLFINSRL
jgi:hypothetical protein